MPDHLLNGKWTTRVIRENGTIVDGDLDLDITPPKTFNKGKHKGHKLKCNAIDETTIELEELEGTFGTLRVEAAAALPVLNVKGFVGSVKFPDEKAQRALGQNDGVWIGTQP